MNLISLILNIDPFVGMWVFNLVTLTWEQQLINNTDPLSIKLQPRALHSMIYKAENNSLIIFGGYKTIINVNQLIMNNSATPNYFSLFDMNIFNIDMKVINQINNDFSKVGGPDVNIMNPVYNKDKDEIILFGGKQKLNMTSDMEKISNKLWVYSFKTEKWKLAEKREDNTCCNFDKLIKCDNLYQNLYNINSATTKTQSQTYSY